MPNAIVRIEVLANFMWDQLARIGVVDSRGSTEYERRIAGLRAWLWDTDGQPPEVRS